MAKYRAVNSLSDIDAASIAGLMDGEGTVTLSRKHANENRQLVMKITGKKTVRDHHAPGFAYAVCNRQALSLLIQIRPFLQSYKRQRADLLLDSYVRMTPRNGKYTPVTLAARERFAASVLALRANHRTARTEQQDSTPSA